MKRFLLIVLGAVALIVVFIFVTLYGTNLIGQV